MQLQASTYQSLRQIDFVVVEDKWENSPHYEKSYYESWIFAYLIINVTRSLDSTSSAHLKLFGWIKKN